MLHNNIVLQVFRNIHPVGQGAFYSETLHVPGSTEDKYIVYDCGTSSKRGRLNDEISGALPDGKGIDVLFISHFHEDHINGIKNLAKNHRIKYVVLPQIDGYEWFFVVNNYLNSGNDSGMPDTDFLDDLRGALKESKIIQVSPAAGDMSPVSEQSMPFDSAGPIFDGGSPLRLDNKLWHYVAVNPLSKDKLESLRKEIETLTYGGKPVNVADLRKPEFLIALSSELRDRYEKVFKGGNEYSMCVLSEAENRYKFEFYSHLYHIRENAAYGECWGYRHSKDGALYTGDADFLNTNALKRIHERLGEHGQRILLLQLPHHGSIHNFNVDLLNWAGSHLISFACYGKKNSFHHPSSVVMGTAGTYGVSIGMDETESHALCLRTDIVGTEEK